MTTLIKNITIADTLSPYNGQSADILIRNNRIEKVGRNLKEPSAKIILGKNQYVSPGWVDILADYREPGQEYKETIVTGLNAAKAGGFAEVVIVPNTNPAIANASMLEFVQKKAAGHSVKLHALGAISKSIDGKELAEMLDMYHSGAVAFSDGWKPVQNAQLLLKALEYVKAFDGTIVQIPVYDSLTAEGLMNEGEMSVKLGMSGMPAMSESLMVHRDLELLRYTGSKIHFSGISTQASISLIRAAKKEGLKVTCSVTPYHLLFNDSCLTGYDSNYKVNPPLRSEKDRKALLKALKDGVVDCIATHHRPQDWDAKTKEFEYAGWGANVQETCWSMLIKAAPEIQPGQWGQLLSANPRKIFNLTPLKIDEGQAACLSIFNFEEKWSFDSKNKQSKGINNPWIGKELTGKAFSL
ncbi:MAG TPA: dihydroorotase [Edaphocola sp.]|nr:dihydroorotase [Edaphocola sp.]